MARRKHLRSRVRPAAALISATVAAALLVPASALGGGAAVDEYSLGAAGGQNAVETDVQRDPNVDAGDVAPQLGVAGENEPSESPLQAAGGALWIAIGVAAFGGIAALAWNRPPRNVA